MTRDRANLLVAREIVAAYLVAIERSEELLQLCADAMGDDNALRSAVIDTFGVSEIAADAVIAMQVRRFTPAAMDRLRAELDDLDRRLAEDNDPRPGQSKTPAM